MGPRKKAVPKRKSKWTPERIVTDRKSPLASADLRNILSNPLSWTSLTIEERKEILSLFPDKAHTLDADTDDARPNFETLLNDDSFRYDCAAYVENLGSGRHDPIWLEDAWRAHDMRKAGEFETWLEEKFVEDWGVEIPEDMRVKKQRNDGEMGQTADGDAKREVVDEKRDEEQDEGGKGGEVDGQTGERSAKVSTPKSDVTMDEIIVRV